MNVRIESVTQITLQRISKYHYGPQLGRRMTAVFIHVSSSYENKMNDAENCGHWKLIPSINRKTLQIKSPHFKVMEGGL